jgi:hypothetical protein
MFSRHRFFDDDEYNECENEGGSPAITPYDNTLLRTFSRRRLLTLCRNNRFARDYLRLNHSLSFNDAS